MNRHAASARTAGGIIELCAGGLAASQYAEITIGTAGYNNAFNAAIAEMADAQQRVVFVAGSADGWLFWSTDSDRTPLLDATDELTSPMAETSP